LEALVTREPNAMTTNDLLSRLCRIYASIKASAEFDMNKLPAKVYRGRSVKSICQDFTGNISESDRANLAHMVIHNIGCLQDHLSRWATANGKDRTKVDATFDCSLDLKIIEDLWNNDKHGHPPRNGGFSRISPRLHSIKRLMRLTTQSNVGSFVTMTLGPGGVPQIAGDGTACAVITGDVVNKDGKLIGNLIDIMQHAIEAWEALMREYGIIISP
jgi:hypothetical protein